MYFPYYDPTMILLIPAMIFAFYAQFKVSSTFSKYLGRRSVRGLTGAQAARRILDSNGLGHIPIEIIPGRLSDHYDPAKRVMRLSSDVFNSTSIAAISVAAHESGHAIQHQLGYSPLQIRNAIAPAVSIASQAAWPLAIVGLIVNSMGLLDLGIILFAAAVFFQLITLPVEFNASSRAIAQLEGLGIIDSSERKYSKKVLSAAAMTYVAAMAVAIANLIRLLVLRGNRD